MTEYRAHPFVANSDLSRLRMDTLPISQQYDLTKAFRMGNLVDALITRHSACDFIQKTVDGVQYDDHEWYVGIQSKRAFFRDTFCAGLHKAAVGQHAIYSEGDRQGPVPYLQGRKCLYDLWLPSVNWGADIKSTMATTPRQFREQIEYLDYDRSRYWYMNTSGAKCDSIIGISKVNFKIFRVLIQEGDDLYIRGRDKAEEWAFKYYMLKQS
jgi:hypothetical protein